MRNITLIIQEFGLDIKIPVEEVDKDTYNYPIPRPIPEDSFLSQSDYTMNASVREFLDDIHSQLPATLDGDLEEIAFESLYQVMVKHINKFGRILPVDLDSYIGQNILLFNAIMTAQGKAPLNKIEQEERFSKFNYMAFGILPENLKVIYRTPF